MIKQLFEFLLHIDNYVGIVIQNYGLLVYLFLFLIIFIETGLVVVPFLPGDSLIFVAGTFASKGLINVLLLFFLLAGAAILGDSINYYIGRHFGGWFCKKCVKPEYIERTEKFYEKYGAKTIIFARYIPIVRTFAPFLAGIGNMYYPKFLFYNIAGGISWVAIFLFGGFLFGGIPFVEKNLTYFIIAIIIASFIPPLIEYIKERRKSKF
jgi:membrane-associated protein